MPALPTFSLLNTPRNLFSTSSADSLESPVQAVPSPESADNLEQSYALPLNPSKEGELSVSIMLAKIDDEVQSEDSFSSQADSSHNKGAIKFLELLEKIRQEAEDKEAAISLDNLLMQMMDLSVENRLSNSYDIADVLNSQGWNASQVAGIWHVSSEVCAGDPTWTNGFLMKFGGRDINCRIWHKLKGQNMTGNAKRSSDDSNDPSTHSKRQRTEPSSEASSPGKDNNSVLSLCYGREATNNGPEEMSRVAVSKDYTPRRKLKLAKKSCLSTPITRWLTAMPCKDQDTARQANEDPSPATPVSIPKKKRSRQRKRKPASKQEEQVNDPPADSPTTSAHETPGGDLLNLLSARKRQAKKTFCPDPELSTSVDNGCTSKEPAPSPSKSQLDATSCLDVHAKK